MNILLFTFSMLTVLVLLTTAQVRQTVDHEMMHEALISHSHAARALANEFQRSLYELKVHSRRKPSPPKKQVPPPNGKQDHSGGKKQQEKPERKLPALPSKLNLAAALLPGVDSQRQEQLQTILKQLMDNLYSGHNFYAREEAERLLEALVDRLGTPREEEDAFQGEPEMLEHLACLQLDRRLQQLWFTMLRGKENVYDSLLDYTSWQPTNRKEKINIPFAPPELLIAMFEDREAVDKIKKERKALIDQYRKRQCKKKEFIQNLHDAIQEIAPKQLENYQALMDYNPVHKPGVFVIKGLDSQGKPLSKKELDNMPKEENEEAKKDFYRVKVKARKSTPKVCKE